MAQHKDRATTDREIDVTDRSDANVRGTRDAGAQPVAAGRREGGPDRTVTAAGNGHAVAALVVGLLAATYAFLAFTAIAAVIFGIVAIGLGIKGKGVSDDLDGVGRGLAISGIVSGALGLLLGIAVIAGAVTLGQELQMDDLPPEIQNTIEDVTGS